MRNFLHLTYHIFQFVVFIYSLLVSQGLLLFFDSVRDSIKLKCAHKVLIWDNL